MGLVLRSPRAWTALAGVVVLLVAVALVTRDAVGQSADELQFTDWTSVSGGSGSGTLRGASVTFTGPEITPPGWTTNGTSTDFSSSSFTPPLPASDAAYFNGYTSYAYALHFGAPMRDPVLHLRSLASRLDFPAGTSITRLSGETGFDVSGSSVIGQLDATSDTDGSVRLNGTFTDISFTATKNYAPDSKDGIYFQVGALGAVGAPPPPAPQVTAVNPPASATAPPQAGKTTVFTAQVSGDAKGLAWDLRGDSRPEIVSNSLDQNSVRFRPQAGSNTVTVYPVLASGLLGNPVVKAFTAPTAAATPTQRRITALVARRPPVDVTGPEDVLLGTGGKTCRRPATMRSSPLEVRGCLKPIKSVDDVPLLERGLLERVRSAFSLSKRAARYNQVFEVTDAFRADGPVTVNGLTFQPLPGSTVIFYPQAHIIAASNALVKVGDLPLQARHDFIINTVDNPGGKYFELGHFSLPGSFNIGGFPVAGTARLRLAMPVGLRGAKPPAGVTQISVNIRLPQILKSGGVSLVAGVNLETTNDTGLKIDRANIGPLNAELGALQLQALRMDYAALGDEWRGQGKACIIGSACLDMIPPNGGVVIQRGKLKFAGASVQFPPPGITLFPGVQLERIGGGIGLDPTRFTANARINALQIYTIDGRMVLAFPSERQPYFLDRREVGNGFPANLYGQRHTRPTIGVAADAFLKAPVVGNIRLGNGYFLYEYPGYVNFGGSMEQSFFKVITITGGVAGEFNSQNGRYNMGGSVRGCLIGVLCRGAAGVISNRGIGACLEVGPLHIGGGATYSPFSIKIWPIDGCKWSPFAEKNVRASQAGATQTVRIARGDPSKVIQLEGTSEAPRVKVTAPDGTTLETPAGAGLVEKGMIRIIRSESASITAVGLQDPKPGDYRIEPLSGSPAIKTIGEADDQPDAKVTARVTGTGATRTLAYDVRRRTNQRVTFTEVARDGGMKAIGTVTGGGKGTLRFSPAPGTGARTVQAQFELDGIPAETRTVARFNPQPPRLARPARVRVRRVGTNLRVSWRAVAGAARYEVVATQTSGAQRIVTTRARSVTVRGIDRASSGRVGVRGIAALRRGQAATAAFRAIARPRTRFSALPSCRGAKRAVCRPKP